ncbi:LOW QUALITY PROTEIN: GTP:AMP phosphotransferase AK3, mitochondrial [Lepeophtheirus salmonis]|uniref:GTP:AMP phosphotransferase, mitochondrial n=1 Tax=Lepeophtheirus salmonis TaxID=72036 RepID=A0A0K2T1E1_LEPSM|nr:LOW QUALITY PROTEIN: GTP:AMP phosphotransferase AK3, mitochondrial-like [Lepeophtheirus salmonis]
MRAPSLFHLSRRFLDASFQSFSSQSSFKHLKALIVGAPGSGKGTISNWIVRDFALAHVSSGDLLRMHLKEKTPLGKKAQQFVDKGELVPDDLMVDLVTSELKKKESTPWLLDGFPRTRFQAEILHERTPVDVVINLDVPFETIIDRVKDRWVHPGSGRIYNTLFNPPKVPGKDDETGEDLMQREDDKPESVRRRLEIFSDSTRPVLDFYRSKGVCTDFKGTESKKIWPFVKEHLDKVIKEH